MPTKSASKTLTRDPNWLGLAIPPGEMLLEEFLKPMGGRLRVVPSEVEGRSASSASTACWRTSTGARSSRRTPTATNNAMGTERFGVGPSVVVLTQPGHWTLGMLINQIWSVSGAKDRTDVNQAFLQPFVNYNLRNGLAA
jgi:hypothetical protein